MNPSSLSAAKWLAGLATLTSIIVAGVEPASSLSKTVQVRSQSLTAQLLPPPTDNTENRTGTIPPPASDVYDSEKDNDPIIPPALQLPSTTVQIIAPPTDADTKEQDRGTIPPPAASIIS
jgi:hypothetical protein